MVKRWYLYIPIIIGVIFILFFGFFRVSNVFSKGEENLLTRSTLMETIDIAELSTSQFTYNGIAKIYDKEETSSIVCHVRYSSTVKAGIDMKDVDFEINNDEKTVKPILPTIKISVNLIDENSFSFIPSKVDVELKEIITSCKKDAEQEASKSKELMESSEENLKSIIEALLYPILEANEYSVIWE